MRLRRSVSSAWVWRPTAPPVLRNSSLRPVFGGDVDAGQLNVLDVSKLVDKVKDLATGTLPKPRAAATGGAESAGQRQRAGHRQRRGCAQRQSLSLCRPGVVPMMALTRRTIDKALHDVAPPGRRRPCRLQQWG